MDSAPGCKSIIGFQNICDLLKEIRPGNLSAPRRAMLSECLNASVVAARASLLRPAL
jgi:hypothetical protein